MYESSNAGPCRATRALAGACIIGIMLTAAAGAQAGFTFQSTAGIGDYVVARLSVPPGAREWVSVQAIICADGQTSPGSTNGFAAMQAVNGTVTGYTLWLGGYNLDPRGPPGSATAAGQQINPALPLDAEEHCGDNRDSFLSPVGPAEMVVVGMSLSPRSTIYVNGSRELDITVSHGIAKTKNQFDEGLHASIYGGSQAAGAGAFTRQTVRTNAASIGWFWPAISGAGHTSYSCSRDGSTCAPPDEDSLHILSAHGPTEWKFAIDEDLRAGEAPYYALGVVELE